MKFVLEKFNQAEKLDNNLNNKTPKRGSKSYEFNSGDKDKDPEDEYNDFEENISIASNNWK